MKYKVGDKVIIRKWDDMERQYGLDCDGDIKTKVCFVTPMREHCGKSVTITGVTPEGNYLVKESTFIFLEDTFEKKHHQKIVITTDGVETLARLYDGDKVVKRAIAKCSPDDTFDFNVGAKLAFERLMKGEEKKPLTFREKLAKEYPQKVNRDYGGGCYGCPKDYGYESEAYCKNRTANCTKCWDRVIPEDKVKKKEEDPPKYYNGKVVCVKSAFTCFWTVGKVYEIKDGIVRADDGTRRGGITKENLKHIGDDRNEFILLVE